VAQLGYNIQHPENRNNNEVGHGDDCSNHLPPKQVYFFFFQGKFKNPPNSVKRAETTLATPLCVRQSAENYTSFTEVFSVLLLG
jgi:carbonic anhydrase